MRWRATSLGFGFGFANAGYVGRRGHVDLGPPDRLGDALVGYGGDRNGGLEASGPDQSRLQRHGLYASRASGRRAVLHAKKYGTPVSGRSVALGASGGSVLAGVTGTAVVPQNCRAYR